MQSCTVPYEVDNADVEKAHTFFPEATKRLKKRIDSEPMVMMLISVVVFFTILIRGTSTAVLAIDDERIETFQQFVKLHQKSYASDQEYQYRQQVFFQNAKVIAKHNAAHDAGWTSYRMTLQSPFADWTAQEFVDSYLMEPQHCSATHPSSGRLRPLASSSSSSSNTPHSFSMDWRTKGIITPIKNQKHCGSCWTFSTTGCLEAHTCLQHHRDCTSWTGLAEQQLVDCAGNYNNFGCNGGLPSQAFEYIKYNGGIDLENSYTYVANNTDGVCKSKSGMVGAQVAEVFNITSRDEVDLMYAVQNIGPVSIAYQVSPDFRFYSHGIYDSFNATTNQTMCHDTPQDVNHAVVAVGLGETADGEPYYIVRNSWGTLFGMEGAFRFHYFLCLVCLTPCFANDRNVNCFTPLKFFLNNWKRLFLDQARCQFVRVE